MENSPVVDVVEAAVNTVANPSVESFLADLELALTLCKDLKSKLSGVHPSILDICKLLF